MKFYICYLGVKDTRLCSKRNDMFFIKNYFTHYYVNVVWKVLKITRILKISNTYVFISIFHSLSFGNIDYES